MLDSIRSLARFGAPPLDLESQIEHVTNARAERLAHFGGLDEFRPDFGHVGEDGYEFWDGVALGHSESSDVDVEPRTSQPSMYELGWEDEEGSPLP